MYLHGLVPRPFTCILGVSTANSEDFFLVTDIREVLKDLQMLSASLLSMEPQSATQEHSSEAMT